MKAKFSRPPWTLLVDKPAHRGARGSVMVAAGGKLAIDCTDSGVTFSESEANGKLIAGAPGLAAELAVILSEMDAATSLNEKEIRITVTVARRDEIRRLLKLAGIGI